MGKVEFGLVVVGAFDDGIDEVCLAALCDLFADELPDFSGAGVGGSAGDDGGASGGHLVDDGEIEIAVEGEGEGARDWGCGHGEDVGIGGDACRISFAALACGLFHQLESLLHAEAVLLVDDDEAEVAEVDLVLLQGVRPDDELRFAAHDSALRLAFGGGVERACEEGDFIGLAGAGRDSVCEEFARGEVVLCGEDLRGGHERDLVAVLDGDERGLHRDDRLAGADIALQEAAHGLGAAHV